MKKKAKIVKLVPSSVLDKSCATTITDVYKNRKEIKEVIVLGVTTDGFTFLNSNIGRKSRINWLIDVTKIDLLNGVYDDN